MFSKRPNANSLSLNQGLAEVARLVGETVWPNKRKRSTSNARRRRVCRLEPLSARVLFAVDVFELPDGPSYVDMGFNAETGEVVLIGNDHDSKEDRQFSVVSKLDAQRTVISSEKLVGLNAVAFSDVRAISPDGKRIAGTSGGEGTTWLSSTPDKPVRVGIVGAVSADIADNESVWSRGVSAEINGAWSEGVVGATYNRYFLFEGGEQHLINGDKSDDAVTWSESEGLNVLPAHTSTEEALGVSADGSIQVGNSIMYGSYAESQALYWDAEGFHLLDSGRGFHSKAHVISPNGDWIAGGAFQYPSLDQYPLPSVAEHVGLVWDPERNVIPLGFLHSVSDISDHGYAVGNHYGGGFIWHESFEESVLFTQWLESMSDEDDPSLDGVLNVEAIAEDPENSKLLFLANSRDRYYFIEVALPQFLEEPVRHEVSQIVGTDSDDQLETTLVTGDTFSIQAYAGSDVIQVTAKDGDASLDVTTGEGHDTVIIDTVQPFKFSINAGAGYDSVRLDAIQTVNFSLLPDNSLVAIEKLQLGQSSQDMAIDYYDVVQMTDSRNTLLVQYDSEDSVQVQHSGWVSLTPEFRDNQFVHRFVYLCEYKNFVPNSNLNRATLEIINERPWQNPLSAFDVNRDESTTALDALVIINRLAHQSANELPDPRSASDVVDYYDVSGDGKATALDALRVINELGRRASSYASGGRSTAIAPPSVPVQPTATDDDDRLQATDAALQQWQPSLF